MYDHGLQIAIFLDDDSLKLPQKICYCTYTMMIHYDIGLQLTSSPCRCKPYDEGLLWRWLETGIIPNVIIHVIANGMNDSYNWHIS